ncbi:Spermidine export protein MdtI [Sporomusa rhizae]|uniref:multidrug/spermidine efflux SMR transporter subunit MdtI n=1 Tax=Sporomusa rhizae TaxID=357999 RepID=UPI003529E349
MSWIFLLMAILLDVVANIVLKLSDGFRRKPHGIFSLLCIMAAFACLAQALQIIELSVAYAFWGAIGLCLTVLCDYFLFGQKLTSLGWFGMLFMVLGVGLLHYTN